MDTIKHNINFSYYTLFDEYIRSDIGHFPAENITTFINYLQAFVKQNESIDIF